MRAHIETRYCCNRCDGLTQGRREPRVGPGTAQILRISGFVQSKTNKENGTLFFGFSSDLQNKKRSSPKLKRFFCPKSGDLLTEKKRSSVFHFDGSYKAQWALSWAPSGPWAPRRSMGPGVVVPLPPPLGGRGLTSDLRVASQKSRKRQLT